MPEEGGGEESRDKRVEGEDSFRWGRNGNRRWGYGRREFGLLNVTVSFLHRHGEEYTSERGIKNFGGDPFDEGVKTV